MIGRRLAQYKVLEQIGAGGMGEVFRAGDSKLGRDVALKMLPAAFARDPERMARFQREAQVLASLNHPNIAAIYGLEEVDDTRFLVLELVDGPTLSERLAGGRLPTAEALEIARQIAEAVECAHESGVIHRDLKPANVKLGTDGRVKVLDFGLAKALDDPAASAAGASDASPTLSPTLSSPITGALTGANVILGTAAYMSPEQARGQSVDKRADIWAFGVILFEMLTGRRLFDEETVSDTLAAVLRKDPDWDALPADASPRIRRLLRRCLERRPKERLRDIGDARLVIAEVLSGAAAAEEAVVAAHAPRRPWLLPAVAVAAAVAGFAIASLGLRPSSRPGELRKYAMAFPEGTRPGYARIAPDASALAYVADGKLHLRELTTLEERTLDERAGIIAPFWSPDGEWVAYAAGNGLWKVRRTGGPPVRITTAPDEEGFSDLAGGAWRPDGRILFTTAYSAVFAVSAQGGEPAEAVPLAEGESDFHELVDLDGRALALVVHGPESYDSIDVAGDDGRRKRVVHYPGDRLFGVAWSPSGHLLFERSGDADGIWALPLSRTFEPAGAAFLVAPAADHPSVARDGTLAYVAGAPRTDTVLGLVSRDGKVLDTLGEPADYHHFPSLSPDGKQIACRIRDGEARNLWLVDVERGARRRLTQGPGNHAWGSWSPDGLDFWYYDEQWSKPQIYVEPANGTGEPRAVTPGNVPEVSPDGRWLLFTHLDPESGAIEGMDLWILDLSREGAEPQPLVADPASQWIHDASPAGSLVAYATRGSGEWQVHLTTYPERRGDWPVSTHGGWWPQWRGDGRELYYAVGDSVMAVDVDPGDGASAPALSRPQLLFRRPRYEPSETTFPDGFEVMPDGQTFVLHLTTGSDADVPPALVVVQNWTREFESP